MKMFGSLVVSTVGSLATAGCISAVKSCPDLAIFVPICMLLTIAANILVESQHE